MATTGLTASEHNLGKIFSSDFEFAIPEYQRPYRWGVEQAIQLLDDLEQSLDRDGDDEYFLGSLVLIEHHGGHFDVVDGQQRLTTLTILFAVLRDLADDPKEKSELTELVFEPGQQLRQIASRVRLRLREDVRDFFRRYVQEPGNTDGLIEATDSAASSEPMRAFRDNASALRSRLSTWAPKKRSELATFMLNKTFLVTVTTPSLPSAHRIFSVMNSRGLDLSPADIFKSMVIGELPGAPEFSLRWENEEESLGAGDFTDLFRDIRTVENGQRARRELLQEFPEQVLDAYLTNGRAAAFIDDVLVPYSEAFARTVAFDFGPGEEWVEVNAWLKRLARIDNKDWRPLAIWAIKNHPDDARFLEAFFGKLERLAASFLLRGVYTTPRLQRYLDLLGELKAGAGLSSSLFDLTPTEMGETRKAIDGDIYRMQSRRARYVLLRLDGLLKTDGGVEYETKLIQIEHALPRTPSDDYWLSRFDAGQRELWTDRLGNLLLLNGRANRKAQNFPFPRKRDEYFAKGSAIFQLTAQVITEPEWTIEIVQNRQADLAGRLFDEWQLQ